MHHTRTFTESRAEDAVRVLKHAVLQTNDNELRALEARLDQTTNVLRVRGIECSINFVQNVHRSRLKLQQSHDEGQGNK